MLGNHTKLMLGLLLATLWTIRPALADTTICVSSPGQLTLALAGAITASGTTTIELVQGTYDVSSTPLANSNAHYNSLHLLGGYTDNTCASRVVDGENTKIDGNSTAGAVSIRMNTNANLVVEGLRFQNFTASSGQQVVAEIANGTGRFRFNHFSYTGLNVAGDFSTTNIVQVLNNLVDASPAGQDGLVISANTNDFVTITGNTIGYAGNRNLYLCMNPGGINNSNAHLSNNIIWGHFGSGGGFDIRIGCDSDFPQAAQFDDNTYGSLNGSEASGSSGTLLSDPLYIGGGNYRLQTPLNSANTSPSVNSGDNSAGNTGTDLDGNSRIVGSAVDRGAYESPYDDTASTTIVVTNTNDSGPGSLRDAITQANTANLFHYIVFNIPSSCPQIITLNSVLPAPKYGMRINGFSQPGTSVNTLDKGDNAKRCIVLNGGGTIAGGLSPFFSNANSQFWVQGLVFEGFHGGSCGGTAVGLVFAGTGALIWGNQFGGKLGNLALTFNDIDINAGFNTNIGGSDPAQRNIIAGARCNNGSGIGIQAGYSQFFGGSSGVSIVNNLIGADASESTSGGNDIAMWIQSSGNTVGGNVIVNNQYGVRLEGANATGNTVDHNLIGVTETNCVTFPFPICFGGINAGNSFSGVQEYGPGSGNAITNNTIWNSQAGIDLAFMGSNPNTNPQRITISGNSIYQNTNAGISLGMYAPGSNDADPAIQVKPNRSLNPPEALSAIGGTTSGVVSGTLQSTNHIYNIEVFSSLQCTTNYGQGQFFHGSGPATISNAPSGQNGSTSFSIPFNAEAGGNLGGRFITLTATDDQGNTSMYSPCKAYTCDVIFKHGFDSATAEKCP